MTIAIAVSTSEGLVLAADSRTTQWVQSDNAKWLDIATDHARKVFALSRRTGGVTHGRSQRNRQTIAGLADRFRWARANDAAEDISVVVEEFAEFLRRAEEAESRDSPGTPSNEITGFLIGGYSNDGVGKLYELQLPEGKSAVLSTTEAPNYHWRGHGEAISRVMKGIDSRVDRSRLDPETAEVLVGLEYAVKLRHMSLRDAIDFARFLGNIAIGIDRFTSGTLRAAHRHHSVGGELTIATITVEGFHFVQPPATL